MGPSAVQPLLLEKLPPQADSTEVTEKQGWQWKWPLPRALEVEPSKKHF